MGKNPKNGGNPPKERKFNKIYNLIILFILVEKIWLIKKEFIIKNIIQIIIIIKK